MGGGIELNGGFPKRVYRTFDGKDHFTAKKVDLKKFGEFLTGRGYDVESLEQQWRHAHGIVNKGGEKLFVKVASTSGIGERTKNEVSWNDQMNRVLERTGYNGFSVPEVLETGEYEGKYYYVSTHHPGELFAKVDPVCTKGLGKRMDDMVGSTLFLLSLSGDDFSFYRDREKLNGNGAADDFVDRTEAFYKRVGEFGLGEVYEEAKRIKKGFTPAVNHVDFVPWHMIDSGGGMVLIDGEHASVRLPKYYDVVNMYNYISTKAEDPVIARRYLGEVKQSLSELNGNFESMIRPIIAGRIIGQFWGAKYKGNGDVTRQKALMDDFLEDRLY